MIGPFGSQVEGVRRRVAELVEALDDDSARPEEVAREALEELAATIEELFISGEELATQTEALMVARDVAERQRRYFASLFQSAPAAGIVTDGAGTIVEVNERAALLLGSTAHFLVGKPLAVFVTADYQPPLFLMVDQARARPGEARRDDLELRRRSGEVIRVVALVTAAAVESGEVQHGWFLDEGIHRRRFEDMTPTEQEVTSARLRLDAIVAAASDGVVSVDDEQRIVLFNQAAECMFGWDAAEVLGRPLSVLLPPEQRDRHPDHLRQFALGSGGPRHMGHLVVSVIRRNGEQFPASITISRVRIDGHWIATALIRDVTEAFRARRELEFATEFNQRILDTIDALVIVGDVDGRVILFNDACQRATGFTLADIRRDGPEILLPEHERDRSQATIARLLAGTAEQVTVEGDCHTADGGTSRISWSLTRLTDASGSVTHLIGTGIDVSHERELETQLENAQRMELLGQMAAGVAHDLNNMLSVAQGQVEFLADTEDLPESAPVRLEALSSALRRSAALVANLSAAGSHAGPTPGTVRADEVVGSMVRLFADSLGEGIELVVDLAADADLVRIDPTRLEQVVLNLIVNARDALGGTGKVVLRSRTDTRSEGPVGFVLTVADDGPGIDDAIRARIFEPFVTTKSAGGGLGLATSAMVIERAGGTISAGPSPQGGTVMTVWLPIASDLAGRSGVDQQEARRP